MIALICSKPAYPAVAPILIDWYAREAYIDGLLIVQGLGTDDRPDLLEAHVPRCGAHIDCLVHQRGLLMDCLLCRGSVQMIALICLKPTYPAVAPKLIAWYAREQCCGTVTIYYGSGSGSDF
jgi:hypothetical protein